MLISLIASQAAGCQYCQAHMANLAAIYEASKEKIEAVWEWETSPLFSNAEKAALTLAFHASVLPNEDCSQLAVKYIAFSTIDAISLQETLSRSPETQPIWNGK